MSLHLAATLLGVAALLIAAIDFIPGMRRVRGLRDVDPATAAAGLPGVSVVIAARNEERNIGEALRSVLALDYPDLEVIVIDDRSEDRTGEIVGTIAVGSCEGAERLRVLRVDALPDGWLGKNHALWQGVRHSSRELLLFTDADVVMHPDALRRAVGYLTMSGADHLTLGPEVRMRGWLLRAFTLSGTLFFSLATRPWKARDPRSRASIGVGAFNLIRRTAYDGIGGHRAIALRPDDDMKLGKLVKKHGFRQDFVHGRAYVWVEWYSSPGELVRGLTKNAFAAIDYNLILVVAGVAGPLLVFVWPIVAAVALPGATRAAALAAIGLALVLHVPVLRTQRVPAAYVVFYPVIACLSVYVLLRSTIVTLLRGGIEWRGTRYPLALLRSNRV